LSFVGNIPDRADAGDLFICARLAPLEQYLLIVSRHDQDVISFRCRHSTVLRAKTHCPDTAHDREMIPILLDVMTVFFLVAGGVLLWLNLRPRRRDVIVSAHEETDRSPDPQDDHLNGYNPTFTDAALHEPSQAAHGGVK
jgi:hypothetical protein